MPRGLLILLLPILSLSFGLPPLVTSTTAQTNQRCFAETGYCISGRLRSFWESAGGLAVFGLPIAPQQSALIEGQVRQIQWFERARLELHPANPAPYDVQLGRLGIERLTQQQRDWQSFSPSEPQPGCRFFPETSHNVCSPILEAWQSNGLELDGQPGFSAAESLALFGLPLSPLQTETLSTGQDYAVQWFERARFEIHPGGVLLGLLGSETRASEPPDSLIAPPLMSCLDPLASAPAQTNTAFSTPSAAPHDTATAPAAQGVQPLPECPAGVNCSYTPAYYGPNNTSSPFNYGNYSYANRPADGIDVRYIVLHNTEEDYPTTINIFQDPAKYVSVHYVINIDGSITQMVPTRDIGWHGGNSYVYDHAIGIEHIGYAIEGNEWYTDAMYTASARLVRYLAERYDIPLDRTHIIGHDEIPGRTPRHQAAMHWDPGPFWNWERYMELIGAPLNQPSAPTTSNLLTITPNFDSNRPPMTYCYPGSGCRAVPEQSANFVYVYSSPDFAAPLLTDAHQGGSPTDASYWGSKLMAGQQVYRVGRQGDWDAIYFGGQLGWFYNPAESNTTPASGILIMPRQGRTTIPAYGHPYIEPEAFPPGSANLPRYGYRFPEDYAYAPGDAPVPLYEIPAGQVYVAADQVVQGQYVSTPYAPNRAAANVLIVDGQTTYYQVAFNHRFVYLRADDVDVLTCAPPAPTD